MAALGRGVSPALRWGLPAGVGMVFVAFSLGTVAHEGLVQVWLDLVFAVGIGFALVAPRARAVGMPLLRWAAAVNATACIALFFRLARLRWLEEKATPRP